MNETVIGNWSYLLMVFWFYGSYFLNIACWTLGIVSFCTTKYSSFKQLFLPRSSILMPQGFKALPSLSRHPDRGAAGCWWDLMCRIQECDSLRALRTEEERLWVISAKSSVQPAAAAFNFTVHPPSNSQHHPLPPQPPHPSSQPASISMLRTLTSTLAY